MKNIFIFILSLLQCVSILADTGSGLRKIVDKFDLTQSAQKQLEHPSLGKMKKLSRPYRYFPELAMPLLKNKKCLLKRLENSDNQLMEEWKKRKKVFDKFFITKAGSIFSQSDMASYVFKNTYRFTEIDETIKKEFWHILFNEKPVAYVEFKNGNIALSLEGNKIFIIEMFTKNVQKLSLEQAILLAKLSNFAEHDVMKIHPEWFEILLTVSNKVLFLMHNFLPKIILEDKGINW